MFNTIINIATTIVLILIMLDWYRLQRMTRKLERDVDQMYQGIILILYVHGILKPKNKGKVLDTKNKKVSLEFNIELLKRVDEKNQHKKDYDKYIKNLAEYLTKIVRTKKKGKKK